MRLDWPEAGNLSLIKYIHQSLLFAICVVEIVFVLPFVIPPLLIPSSFLVLHYHAPTTTARVAAHGQTCRCGLPPHQYDSAVLSVYTTD